jgi:hypothetical protein
MAKRTLSAGRPRSEIISSFSFGALAAEPPPNADDSPVLPGDEADENPVTKAIDAIDEAVQSAVAKQAQDPDDKTDPDDKPVDADLAQIAALVEELKDAQAKDAANDPAAPAAPSPADDAPVAPAKPAVPPAASAAKLAAAPAPSEDDGTGKGAIPDMDDQIDEEGNVDPTVKCVSPDCGHLASAHEDLTTGDNSGACSMQGCECAAMSIDSKQLSDDENDGGGGPDNSGGGDNAPSPAPGDEQTAATDPAALPVAAPAAPDVPPSATEPNLPPEMDGGASMGPAFTIPVAIILNQDTGDGRMIAPNALDWRVPPLPLMGLSTATHDPMGMDQNDPAVICGRIDSLEYGPGEGDTQVVIAKGFYLPNDDGMYFADMTEAMGRCGISADIAVEDSQMEGELDDDGWPTATTETVIKGTIMGLTQCPYPAFQGAYIVIGDGTVEPEPIPQAAEPEPVTAAGIHWMAYEECIPCAQGREIIVASGAGPMRPPAAWFENPGFTIGDDRLREIAATRGNYSGAKKYACPLTVTDDGQVFGHIAPWGVCHTGSSGECIMAPRSKTGYAHFMRGSILTAEGETVPVGTVTADTSHAATRGIDPLTAQRHYDHTGFQAADLAMGEDDFGIWVAGAIRPDATEAQLRMLRASSYSGDWRNMGGGLELVALLAVNQPGFPVAIIASGHIESLVASGASVMFALKQEEIEEQIADPSIDLALRRALAPVLEQMKTASRSRMLSLTAAGARKRLAAIR